MEVDVLKLRLFYRSSITRATARASEVTKRNLTAKEIDNWAGESASLTKEKEMLKYRHTHTHTQSPLTHVERHVLGLKKNATPEEFQLGTIIIRKTSSQLDEPVRLVPINHWIRSWVFLARVELGGIVKHTHTHTYTHRNNYTGPRVPTFVIFSNEKDERKKLEIHEFHEGYEFLSNFGYSQPSHNAVNSYRAIRNSELIQIRLCVPRYIKTLYKMLSEFQK